MKIRNYSYLLGFLTGASSAITKDDILFILGLIMAIINAIMFYLDRKKGD